MTLKDKPRNYKVVQKEVSQHYFPQWKILSKDFKRSQSQNNIQQMKLQKPKVKKIVQKFDKMSKLYNKSIQNYINAFVNKNQRLKNSVLSNTPLKTVIKQNNTHSQNLQNYSQHLYNKVKKERFSLDLQTQKQKQILKQSNILKKKLNKNIDKKRQEIEKYISQSPKYFGGLEIDYKLKENCLSNKDIKHIQFQNQKNETRKTVFYEFNKKEKQWSKQRMINRYKLKLLIKENKNFNKKTLKPNTNKSFYQKT